MSQLGMNLPGGARRRPQMTVYTGMMFVAVVCLAVACVMMWIAASKIGPNGQALEIHKIEKGSSLKFAK